MKNLNLRTSESIKEELFKIKDSLFHKNKNLDKIICNILEFYNTFPQYNELNAFSVHIINVSRVYDNVGVWIDKKGAITFIGITEYPHYMPLASIRDEGEQERLPINLDWSKPETFLTFIEYLPKF